MFLFVYDEAERMKKGTTDERQTTSVCVSLFGRRNKGQQQPKKNRRKTRDEIWKK